jgi:hypothetical protein
VSAVKFPPAKQSGIFTAADTRDHQHKISDSRLSGISQSLGQLYLIVWDNLRVLFRATHQFYRETN